jgi:hypothetical protein
MCVCVCSSWCAITSFVDGHQVLNVVILCHCVCVCARVCLMLCECVIYDMTMVLACYSAKSVSLDAHMYALR